MGGNIVHLGSSNFNDAIKQGKPVLVDFWADWCQPCHMMTPVLDALSQTYNSKIVFAKVDVDSNPDLASAYGIEAIPTFVLFMKGEPQDRAVGAVGRSGIEEMLQRYGLL